MDLRPDRTEAAEYYWKYIDRVPAGRLVDVLETQQRETIAALQDISERDSLHRYAEGKWSIREVLGHINDCERLFVFRAFWFARGFDSPLPSFDQNIAVTTAGSDDRSWQSHIDEFRAVRQSTIAFLQALPDDAWTKRGVASGNPVTVRALAYIAAGHVTHHMAIVKERYLQSV